MRNRRSMFIFLPLVLVFLGWQIAGQFDVIAASLGLVSTPNLVIEDQFIIS